MHSYILAAHLGMIMGLYIIRTGCTRQEHAIPVHSGESQEEDTEDAVYSHHDAIMLQSTEAHAHRGAVVDHQHTPQPAGVDAHLGRLAVEEVGDGGGQLRHIQALISFQDSPASS